MTGGSKFSKSKEALGRFVGIAKHQGDILTYLILTDDTLQVIARLSVRSAQVEKRTCDENGKPIMMSIKDIAAIGGILGQVMLTYSLALVCLFYLNMNWNIAVAFGLLPSLVSNVYAVLTDQARKLGISATAQWIRIFLNGFTSHTLFTNAPYASMILKLYSAWCIMIGSYCSHAPEKYMANGWLLGMTQDSINKDSEEDACDITRIVTCVGQQSMVLGTFFLSLAVPKGPTVFFLMVPLIIGSALEWVLSYWK